jgi:hypothetical protein
MVRKILCNGLVEASIKTLSHAQQVSRVALFQKIYQRGDLAV